MDMNALVSKIGLTTSELTKTNISNIIFICGFQIVITDYTQFKAILDILDTSMSSNL